MFDKLAKTQPFYDLLVRTFGRTAPMGVYTGWTRNLYAVNADPGYYAKELLEIGIPAAYLPENACVTTLCGDAAKAMPASLIEKLLSGGVYMDAKALDHLNHMGYGELTGFEVKGFLEKDCIEVFSEHSFNEGVPAGAERNCYQAFNKGDAAVIERANVKTQILSAMKDYNGNVLSECSWGVFENIAGGRVCVAGYYPWTFIQSRPKVKQLKTLFRWLSKDTLPSQPDSYCRLHNWTRRLENGGMAAALVNGSLETLKDTVILLKTEKTRCFVYDIDCERLQCRLDTEHSGGGYKAFAMPEIKPWQMVLVLTED